MSGIICLGDKTTNGCVVTQIQQTDATIDGKQIATLGSVCSCKKLPSGTCTINQGSQHHDIHGVPVAYGGCTTTCGSTLIPSTQSETIG